LVLVGSGCFPSGQLRMFEAYLVVLSHQKIHFQEHEKLLSLVLFWKVDPAWHQRLSLPKRSQRSQVCFVKCPR
jgi:hypothetical protein